MAKTQAQAKRRLHYVHEVATPHSNTILAALHRHKNTDLNIWVFNAPAGKYGFKNDLTHAVTQSHLYKSTGIDWHLIRTIMADTNSDIMLIGWSNPTTRLLLLLLWLTRRRFGMWFDMPEDSAPRSALKHVWRELFYTILRTSNATVFAVGRRAVEYFTNRGYNPNRVINLPIFVETDLQRSTFAHQKDAIRARYGVGKNDILLSAGSRLIHSKGFDIVIEGIANLPESERKRVTCVIIGQGEELDNLKAQAHKAGILNQIHFPGWMEFSDYQALIAASEAFVHPARFDAWGATIFAHALGVPVIGSTGAGSAFDRVEHGKNGWIFNPDKPAELTAIIHELFQTTPAKLTQMGKAATATAQEWTPDRGAETIVKGLR